MKPKKNPEIAIGRNSNLYFAIGLNLMLIFTWGMLEHKTYENNIAAIDVLEVAEAYEEEIPVVSINTPPPPPPPQVIHETIEIVEDNEEIEETFIESTETDQEDAIAEVVDVEDVYGESMEEEVEVSFAVIEDVPVFPGCEGKSKAATKRCFQKKIQEHVMKHFEYPETALEMGIQGRVSVIFVIDAKGVTRNVRSRGPDRVLEKEAERIIRLLPDMIPGKQRGRPVKVSYAVPIFFKYNNS